MRSFLCVSVLAGLALAAPRPQEIDLDGVAAAPAPSLVTVPIEVASDTVTLLPTSSIVPITTDVAKRSNVVLKRDACQPQPSGSGPVPSPDTADAFQADPDLQAMATNAPTPYGYSLVFSNLGASVSASNYMGYHALQSYDTLTCASLCDQASGCVAFNVFIERDPSIEPAASCPNPSSTSTYKCSLWGAPLSAQEATNNGQWRNDFHVVTTGSNAYNSATPPDPISGFSGPVKLGGAINAPTSSGSYMGYEYFPFSQSQGYDPSTCAVACTTQNTYNSNHPAKDCSWQPCTFFDAYVLSENGVPQGLYCSLYNATWAPSYATNYGQYRGSDRYTVSDSYSYSLNDPPSQPAYAPNCGPSFIKDGGFEDGPYTTPYLGGPNGPWSVQTIGQSGGGGGWSPGYQGNYMFGASLYGSSPAPSVLLTQTLSTVPGTNYAFSMYYKFDYDMDVCNINLTFPDGSTKVVVLLGQTPEEFYQVQATFSGGGSELLTINPNCVNGAGGIIFIDNVSVYLTHT